MNFSITELKKHLGPGLGLRKNRYMVEIPVPTISGEVINVLCQSAGLPERNISTTEVWHKGRKFQVRGETDYVGEYEISIIDDDQMRIRKMFDSWMKQVDNSRPNKNQSLTGTSFEENTKDALALINNGVNTLSNQRQLVDFAISVFDKNLQGPSAAYQTDINIWQMDNRSTGKDSRKVYGYKLQNAFPKSIGIVTLEDAEENTLSQFSVTFAFSEFTPLFGAKEDILSGIIGDETTDILRPFT